ncbi:MAG: hypothetical protein WCR92_06175 [Candidatus Cloacimonadaceae bacterium]
MLRFRSKQRLAAVRRGILLILLLAFGAASFALGAEALSGPYRHQNGVFLLQSGGEWDGAETAETAPSMEPETEAASREQLPAWLQIIILVGIALLIHFTIQAIIQRRRRRDEEIIHYKDVEGSTGYEQPEPPAPVRLPGQKPAEYRVPPQPRVPPQERAPEQSRQQPAKKSLSWGLIVGIIAVLNIIRRCVQNN